jgi:hypothetical protein
LRISNFDFEITPLEELGSQAPEKALLALLHVTHIIELHELDLPTVESPFLR